MDPRVQTVVHLMKASLDRQVSVREMAESAHLSASHLRHLFKGETGTSLARYHRELRMEAAKDLLTNTFLSVKEVAARVGIADLSHFVRDFEKTYGVTPLRYRARCIAPRKPHLAARIRQIR